MNSIWALVFACMMLATQVRLASAQSPPDPAQLSQTPQTPPASQTPVLSAQSTLVLVPALVRTKGGGLVFNLAADDFVLTDDGIPQKVRLEPDPGGEPLALVVVIEIGGAGAREFNKYSSIAPPLAPMLDSVVGAVPHKVAVVVFDSEPTLLQDFTPDTDLAANALRTLTPGCTRQHHLENCASPLAIHNVALGDNGAAILDSLGFAVELLRRQPAEYRRAILLISETLDRGSRMTLEDALREISDTNTVIYSIGFSTGKSEAAHYGARELATQPGELGEENHHPNPEHGCMGKDPNPDPDATHNKAVQAYDCLTQLVPPLAMAKMAAIAATDGLQRNIPATVAHLTGGEYFKLTDPKSLERDLATISNHIPNRYVLSFQPQSPHAGLHALGLRLDGYPKLEVTARSGYWADTVALPAGSVSGSH
jgi:VWFA-related protein